TGISQSKHCVMKRPEEVILSREEGEALLERLERDAVTAEDRRGLGEGVTFYFLLLFSMRGAKLSLQRLKGLVFWGEAEEAQTTQATGSRRDGGRWKHGRERHTGQFITRSATFRCPIVVGEEVVAWAWAVRGRRVSGSKDSRVSA